MVARESDCVTWAMSMMRRAVFMQQMFSWLIVCIVT